MGWHDVVLFEVIEELAHGVHQKLVLEYAFYGPNDALGLPHFLLIALGFLSTKSLLLLCQLRRKTLF